MRRFFTGASVRTMDPDRPLADLVVVEDGIISAVGRQGEVAVEPAPGDELHDLRGTTILPGFIDAHIHLTQMVWDISLLDLSRTSNLSDLRDLIADHVKTRGTGGWVVGRGLPGALFLELKSSTGKVLDDLGGGEPLILGTEDTHSSYLNERGAGILASGGIFDPSRAELGTVKIGKGIVISEKSSFDAWRWLAERERVLDEEAFVEGVGRCHSAGVTGVYTFETIEDIHAILSSSACGEGLRVVTGFYEGDLARIIDADEGIGDGEIEVGGLKLFVDGALGSGTAYLLEPYEDQASYGIRSGSPEQLVSSAERALEKGFGICCHAIGDAAVRIALDLLEDVASGSGIETARKRLEHIQLLHPDDETRFGELGVTASVQPAHLITDRDLAWKAWGERCGRSYPLRRLIEGGARIVFGSDAPVSPVDPLQAIRIAVTRRLGDEAAGEETWYSGEEIPVQEAVRAHTVEAARVMGMEDTIGRVREGYRADMVILSRDPFRSVGDLVNAEVTATFVGGECVYDRDKRF